MEINCTSDPGSTELPRKHINVFVTKKFENVSLRYHPSFGATGLTARAVITSRSNGESYYECFEIRTLKIKRETKLELSLTEDTAIDIAKRPCTKSNDITSRCGKTEK
jgi:hypothetical protein